MEYLSSLNSCSTEPPLTSTLTRSNTSSNWRRRKKNSLQTVSAISYPDFVHHALKETTRHTVLVPSPLQEKFNSMIALDGKTKLELQSFRAPKLRLLRSMSIESESLQVLDFAAFPEPEFDVPIFCANFFTSASTNIVVLDLNPLHDVISKRDYKEKYYKQLMPLCHKYVELLPWGGKLTGESIKFFSPIVIWTKFTSSQDNHEVLYTAFMDYYQAWLELIGQAVEETNVSQVIENREAQHRYLTWRTEKDPGQRVLNRLIGETNANDLLKNFLFNGMNELGNKTFVDYFPEYRCEDGTINEKRSIIGRTFENRPWNTRGDFISENES